MFLQFSVSKVHTQDTLILTSNALDTPDKVLHPQRWPGSIWKLAGGLNRFNPIGRKCGGTAVIYLFTSACKLCVCFLLCSDAFFRGADAKRISNWFVITKAYRASHDVCKH